MKKRLSMILSAALILTMLLSLVGCGGKSDQEKFVGTWEATYDMTDYVNEALAGDPETAEYLEFDEFEVTVVFTYKEDGTYEMMLDEDSVEEAVDGIRDDFADGMRQYMEDTLAASGLDMTVDELLAAEGGTLDDVIDEGMDLLIDSLSDMKSEGQYKAEGGKLYTSDDVDSEIDEDAYETYEISDDELKLTGYVGDEEGTEDMYPMTFKKVS